MPGRNRGAARNWRRSSGAFLGLYDANGNHVEGGILVSQIRPESLREVVAALKRYEREVEQSRLKPSTKRNYVSHARIFVNWLKGDFTPGSCVGLGQGRPYSYWR